jgi:hypothetical protein
MRKSLWLSLSRHSLHLHLAPTRCHICTCKKQTTTNSINIYSTYIWTDISQDNINQKHTQYSTYLDGQKPPQEAAPCPGPPGSQPQHRGTEVLPAASAAISVPPPLKSSGHLRHHRGEPKLQTTTSIAALVPPTYLVKLSVTTSAPSPRTMALGSTQR